jgi:TP901 family phage tail tape measure protein
MGRLVGELGTVLKNTVKWQFSSSMLHGVIGATQKAFSYAKDLNASLNDIRIVTGASADEMDKFAAKAQKAAKALSATTLDYTKASLIYYQQGLSDSEVQERTNVTVKMANVTKDSAQTVSDQLTAVWNNFDNGSKSLEYYADVMTALGAATASSTSEISEGLEKFAAVADSVGLSYEYATAALATVTATTRQSADVVGTAFKTLFARLQDLELGESLDDGTTLGKYSAALAAAGVNIKNASGELKDMDVILEELGGKWTSLSKDTQIALAQTVAGTRQYTQLVALMDNWQYFQKNLSVAKASEGTLDE